MRAVEFQWNHFIKTLSRGLFFHLYLRNVSTCYSRIEYMWLYDRLNRIMSNQYLVMYVRCECCSRFLNMLKVPLWNVMLPHKSYELQSLTGISDRITAHFTLWTSKHAHTIWKLVKAIHNSGWYVCKHSSVSPYVDLFTAVVVKMTTRWNLKVDTLSLDCPQSVTLNCISVNFRLTFKLYTVMLDYHISFRLSVDLFYIGCNINEGCGPVGL